MGSHGFEPRVSRGGRGYSPLQSPMLLTTQKLHQRVGAHQLKMAGGEGLEPSQTFVRQSQNLVRLANFAIPLLIEKCCLQKCFGVTKGN